MRQLGYLAVPYPGDVIVFAPDDEASEPPDPNFYPGLDARQDPVPTAHLAVLLERAGIDQSVFLTLLDSLG
jgi:hypothetical protein